MSPSGKNLSKKTTHRTCGQSWRVSGCNGGCDSVPSHVVQHSCVPVCTVCRHVFLCLFFFVYAPSQDTVVFERCLSWLKPPSLVPSSDSMKPCRLPQDALDEVILLCVGHGSCHKVQRSMVCHSPQHTILHCIQCCHSHNRFGHTCPYVQPFKGKMCVLYRWARAPVSTRHTNIPCQLLVAHLECFYSSAATYGWST